MVIPLIRIWLQKNVYPLIKVLNKNVIYLTTNLKQAQTVKRETATGLLMNNLLILIHHRGTIWNIFNFVEFIIVLGIVIFVQWLYY